MKEVIRGTWTVTYENKGEKWSDEIKIVADDIDDAREKANMCLVDLEKQDKERLGKGCSLRVHKKFWAAMEITEISEDAENIIYWE